MEHGRWYAAGGIILVILSLLGAAYFLRAKRISPPSAPVPVVTITPRPVDLTGLSIYTDGEHGFSLFYPANDQMAESFDPTSSLPDEWRLGASATGSPILAIQDASAKAEVSEVRVGASTNKQEVKQCLRPGPGETKLADVHLGGTTFKSFSFDRTGTDDEVMVTSYRAVHDGSCVAIESFLSSGVASSTDLAGIIQSFSFARP